MKGPTISGTIEPVLQAMPEGYLKARLQEQLPRLQDQFLTIEQAFNHFTAGPQSKEFLRTFFHNWALTNNSAVTVAGLGNRVTALIAKEESLEGQAKYGRVVASLHRIIDEDLAVVGSILHSELFYRMACGLTGDDAWQSRRFLLSSSQEFKAWKDGESLYEPDILVGLLTTLCHEIYTHGEVEYIWPLFSDWLAEHHPDAPASCLAWIKVHTGPTERNHFFHAVEAIDHWVAATGARLEDYDLGAIFTRYLDGKAAVMRQVREHVVPAVAA